MVLIKKASGNLEKFSSNKVKRTCLRAGASKEIAIKISNEISRQVYEGMSSRQILTKVISLLKKYKKNNAALKYNLKRAIMDLGPSGFPFEKYFSQILIAHGYKTQVGEIFQGKKVKQEVDIVAEKNKVYYMVECKYHNQPGIYTDLKVAMYTHARFLDLQKKFQQSWLVTNTKCSFDARDYSIGVNQKITSWDYPKNENLRQLIESKKIYPITILNNLSSQMKRLFFESEILSLNDLINKDINQLIEITRIQKKILLKVKSQAESFIRGVAK